MIEALGGGRRPPVSVTVGGHTYRTTAMRMGERFFVGLSAENRAAAGVSAGDDVEVEIELDTAAREVALPADLAAAMDPDVRAQYERLSFTHRKEWVRWVEDAKRSETRATRIGRTVAALREGRTTR